MILTNDELKQLQLAIEEKSGYDPELLKRCGHLIHIGAFDEAVRNAFVLLEERLRTLTKNEGATGTNLANYAFNVKDGPLAKQLTHEASEREGLRELFSGAFKLFRNPTAHGVVNYDSKEGKSILTLVNLLLLVLNKVEEVPPPDLIPANVMKTLLEVERVAGASTTSRLQTFFVKSIKLGIKPDTTAKQWIPFKRHALMKYEKWDKPRSYPVALYYFVAGTKDQFIQFPVQQYYKLVIGLDTTVIQQKLYELGFNPVGMQQYFVADLRIHNDQSFFDKLYDLISEIKEKLDLSLTKK